MISRNRALKPVCITLGLLLYAAFIFRRVAIGVHIDEEVIVTTAYRWLQGDRFFVHIQEPQMLMAPLIGAIEKLWLLLSGSPDSIFLYMKVVTQIMLLAVSLYLYATLKKHTTKTTAFILTLFYHFYHFRYVTVMDYSFLFTSASLMCLLLWMNYETAKFRYLNLTAVALCFCVMVICFPSSILMFGLLLWLYHKKSGYAGIGIITGVCVIAAAIELLTLFWGCSLSLIPDMIRSVLSGSMYAKSLRPILERLPLILVCTFLFWAASKTQLLTNVSATMRNNSALTCMAQCLSYLFLLSGIFSLMRAVFVNLEYYNKAGYASILAFGAIQLLLAQDKSWMLTMFLWGLLSGSFVLFMTRYDTVFIYALPSLVATLAILLKNIAIEPKIIRRISAVLLLFFLAAQFFSKDVLMISNNNHSGDTVFNQELVQVKEGPAKGSFARAVDVQKYEEIHRWIGENITKKQKVGYFGKNVLLYLMSANIEVAVPQLFMDYSSDLVLAEYYLKHPEKYPDIVILDVSPSSKRLIHDEERKLFEDYDRIYQSENYEILQKEDVHPGRNT